MKQHTDATSLQVSTLAPGTVDLILGSDFTGLAPQSPQVNATPSTGSSQAAAGASPSASASASGVTGLAQSNGGITAAAACTADGSAFSGPLSP
jgi:hypothetical protein